MARKNKAAVSLGKLRAKRGPSMQETGRRGGLAKAKRIAAAGAEYFPEGAAESGGQARAASLTPEQRKAIGRAAAAARWGKKGKG